MRKTLQGTGDTYGGHLIPTPATLGAAPESRLMPDLGDVVDEIVTVVENGKYDSAEKPPHFDLCSALRNAADTNIKLSIDKLLWPTLPKPAK